MVDRPLTGVSPAEGTLSLCRLCGGAGLLDGLRRRIDTSDLACRIRVEDSDCLGPCAPLTLCLHGPGRAGYVFAGLDAEADAGDILATCRAWLAAEQGWIEDARPCGRLRFCLTARVPA